MPPGDSRVQRLHVLYQGNVQGVGFRFTVCELARPLRVTGYVRNLPSGEVEVLAEGKPRQLDTLLHEIAASRLNYYIQSSHETRGPACGESTDFRIWY